MYNYFMIFGRLLNDPEIKDVGDGKKVVNVLVGINRSFKNMDGEYTTDVLKISLWEFLADYASDTFKKGSNIGIKGRMVPVEVEIGDGKKAIYHNLIGERIVLSDYPTPKDFLNKDITEEES